MTPLVVIAAVFALSAIGTGLARRLAIRFNFYDEPNDRSSHFVPTPRLGGAAIALSALAGWTILIARADAPPWHAALAAGAALASLTGLVDDFRNLPPATKFIGELIAVALPVAALAAGASGLSLLLLAGAALFAVSYINFFNFMDGVDGLAATVAALSAAGFAMLAAAAQDSSIMWLALAVSAAACGFLVHNYPPATIFMGDGGSLFLGFALAMLALAVTLAGVSWTASIAVLTPFLFDTVFTLMRRARRGETLWKAHRSHLYQRLLQSGVGARQVAAVYMVWTVAAALLAFAGRESVTFGGAALAAASVPGFWLIVAVHRRERAKSSIISSTFR